MKIGTSSMFLWNFDIDQLCFKLPEIGFDALDIWFDSPSLYLVDEKTVREKLALVRQSAMTKVSHIACHDLNPCSYSQEVRNLTLQQAQKSILNAADMGAEFVTIHGGHNSFGKKCSKYDRKLFFEYLRTLIDWNPTAVILTVENSPFVPYKLLNSPEIVSGVLDNFEDLRMTFDYAHVPLEYSNAWGSFLRRYDDRLAIVHLSSSQREHHRVEFDNRFSRFLGWLKDVLPNIISILEYEQDNLSGVPLRVLEEDARKLRLEWEAAIFLGESPLSNG